MMRRSSAVTAERNSGDLMRCSRCGALNPDDSRFCGFCGQYLIVQNYAGYNHPSYQRTYGSSPWKGVAAVLVLLIAFYLGAMYLPVCDTTLTVKVSSSHILYSVHYQIFVNGIMREEGNLAALASTTWTLDYKFSWAFTGQQSIVIKGTGTGGGLGDTSDSHTLTVVDSQTYSVTLNV
jgi:hypothetical protein